MLFYGLTTYIVLIVTFNLPFLMEEHHFSSGNSGMMISLFFLAIMAPGFFLGHVVKYLKEKTKFYSLLCIALGLALIWISPKEWLIIPGCILVGLGYGVIQPLIYDKTVDTGCSPENHAGIGFCDGNELSGRAALSVYRRFLPIIVSCTFAGVSVYL